MVSSVMEKVYQVEKAKKVERRKAKEGIQKILLQKNLTTIGDAFVDPNKDIEVLSSDEYQNAYKKIAKNDGK